MKRDITLIAILLLVVVKAMGQEACDTMAAAEHHSLWQQQLTLHLQNPAFMNQAYRTSYSEIGIYGTMTQMDQPVVLQEGGDAHQVGAQLNTYLQLGSKSHVWGSASYQQGKKKDVQWNNNSDYRLLFPYVLADTLGGEMKGERYTFSGGYATEVGRFNIGAQMAFRAEHEYRTYDPRPRNIVTDLVMSVGAHYQLPHYDIGVSVGGKFYKQTSDVQFYREEGVSSEYQMVGLGADYVRFRGINRSAHYKGTGLTASVDLVPQQGQGLYVSATVSDVPYQRILTNLNAMPISKLILTNYKAEAGWKHEGRHCWAVFAGVDYEKRQGDELVAGSSSSTEYDEIGHLTMYRNHLADYHLGGAMAWKGRGCVTLALQGGWQDYASSYVFPERAMDFQKAYGSMKAQWQQPVGDFLLDGTICAAYYAQVDDHLVMPYGIMDDVAKRMVDCIHQSATASYLTTDLQLRASYHPSAWKRYSIYLQADGGWVSATNDNQVLQGSLAMGVNF